MTVIASHLPSQLLNSRKTWSLADYYALPEGRPYYEFYKGKLNQVLQPPIIHQVVRSKLYRQIDTYLDDNKIGECFSGVRLELSANNIVYVSNLLFIANTNKKVYVGEKFVMGIPDLVVEISSPSTNNHGWGEKFDNYERCGVPFYWIVDLEGERIWEYECVNGTYVMQFVAEKNKLFSPNIFPRLNFNLEQLMGKSPEKKEDNQNE